MTTEDEKTDAEKVLSFLGAPFFLFVAVPALTVYGAWVFMLIWNWFAPTFTSIRLTLPLALGTLVLLTQIRGRFLGVMPEKSSWRLISEWLITDSLALFIAWIAHGYVR